MVTMAVRQAAAKAKPIEVLRIMTITCDEGPKQTPEKAFPFRTASHREEAGGNGGIRRRSAKTGGTKGSDLLHHHATDVSVIGAGYAQILLPGKGKRPTIALITPSIWGMSVAQRIAGHADSRTTKLYDRRGQKVLLEDMERIRY